VPVATNCVSICSGMEVEPGVIVMDPRVAALTTKLAAPLVPACVAVMVAAPAD